MGWPNEDFAIVVYHTVEMTWLEGVGFVGEEGGGGEGGVRLEEGPELLSGGRVGLGGGGEELEGGGEEEGLLGGG